MAVWNCIYRIQTQLSVIHLNSCMYNNHMTDILKDVFESSFMNHSKSIQTITLFQCVAAFQFRNSYCRDDAIYTMDVTILMNRNNNTLHPSWPSTGLPLIVDNGLASPDSKVHGANMGPIWGRQDPGGTHVSPMNFVIWVLSYQSFSFQCWIIFFLPIPHKIIIIRTVVQFCSTQLKRFSLTHRPLGGVAAISNVSFSHINRTAA